MAFASSQRLVYKIGNVENWVKSTDLRSKRIRLIDLGDEVVGRAAAQISMVLQGKDRPDYDPVADVGDVVVAINADRARLTGKKLTQKVYYRHSGKPGALRQSTPEEEIERFGGAAVLWKAVRGMLPKNKLRAVRMRKLLIYNGPEHDFDDAALFPLAMPPRKLRPSKLRWHLPEGYAPMNAASFFRNWMGCDPDWEAKMAEVLAREAAEAAAAPPLASDSPSLVERQGLRLQ